MGRLSTPNVHGNNEARERDQEVDQIKGQLVGPQPMHRGHLASTLLSILSVSYTLTLQLPTDTLDTLDTFPLAMGLDVDSYPPTPSGLSLEQVHVYIRHGEPLPVHVHLYPLSC
jgi:hypothetical protein